MSWRYGIVRRTHADGEVTYGVHEVYRDDDRVTGWTKDPVALDAESVAELQWMLERMLKALDGPVVADEAPTRAGGMGQ